jgi:hypothetical protein
VFVLVWVGVRVVVFVIVGVGVGGGGQDKSNDQLTGDIGEVIITVTEVGFGKVLLKVMLPEFIPDTLGYPNEFNSEL